MAGKHGDDDDCSDDDGEKRETCNAGDASTPWCSKFAHPFELYLPRTVARAMTETHGPHEPNALTAMRRETGTPPQRSRPFPKPKNRNGQRSAATAQRLVLSAFEAQKRRNVIACATRTRVLSMYLQ